MVNSHYRGACNSHYSSKERDPSADPLGTRQPPLQVYATKPSPQVGMEKGKAQYELDDVQEGEEAGNPNAKRPGFLPAFSATIV